LCLKATVKLFSRISYNFCRRWGLFSWQNLKIGRVVSICCLSEYRTIWHVHPNIITKWKKNVIFCTAYHFYFCNLGIHTSRHILKRKLNYRFVPII
jgi:hypothetical protein